MAISTKLSTIRFCRKIGVLSININIFDVFSQLFKKILDIYT